MASIVKKDSKAKRFFLCHMRFQHIVRHLIKCMVQTKECPYCRSTFASQQKAQQHAVQAISSNTCKTDQGHFNTPLIPLSTYEGPLCEHTASSHDAVQRHIIKHSTRRPQYLWLTGQARSLLARDFIRKFHLKKLRPPTSAEVRQPKIPPPEKIEET